MGNADEVWRSNWPGEYSHFPEILLRNEFLARLSLPFIKIKSGPAALVKSKHLAHSSKISNLRLTTVTMPLSKTWSCGRPSNVIPVRSPSLRYRNGQVCDIKGQVEGHWFSPYEILLKYV
ncbi:hypothetical protein TNCV_551791 [Trichonephila clavipes]|nr:hypothetical protein TNCV_551791 [Trichonephila clavipes]